MAGWGRFAHRHAWPIIALSLAIVSALASQLPQLELETSTEGFLHEDDPVRITYDEFRAQFGREDQVVMAIETENVFDMGFLSRLRSLHADIENEVPHLEEVASLINARNTRGEGDRLIVGELLEDPPSSAAELAEIERLTRANPLFRNLLLSEDARWATVMIRVSAYSSLDSGSDELAGFDDVEAGEPVKRPFLTGDENLAVVHALHALVDRYDADGFRIFMAGAPTLNEAMQMALQRDMVRFAGLAVLVIAVSLAALFRTVAGVVLPLVTVALSLIATLAIMAMAGTPIGVPTQILPSFLLAVGVGYSVHILAIFYQRRRAGAHTEDATSQALGHSGLAIVMTCLTTAGGMASFAAAELAPIADLGVFAPVGVLLAMLFTLILLPALMAVIPMGAGRMARRGGRDVLSQRLLVRIGAFSTRRAGFVTLASAGLLAIALLGALQLRFSHDPIAWFPEDHYARISNDVINDELKGSMFLEALIDTRRENGLHDPQLLERLDRIRRSAESLQVGDVMVGKTISLVDVVKETNQALNENRPEFYSIPSDRLLVAQELLLFENSGSDDLEDLVDSSFSQARMTFKVSMRDAIEYHPFIEHLDRKFAEILGDEVEYTFTGLMVIFGGTITALVYSLAKTYIIALAIITPLLVLLIGRVRIGLTAMIPNLTPIVLTLGIMGWTGIPIDLFTLLIGGIAIGLAVDDTIHFMHNFGSAFEATGDAPLAIRETLRSTGQALLYTSIVLSLGFFIYTFAAMENLFNFGFLTGLTIILAFLADVILAPALLTFVASPAKSRRRRPGRGSNQAEQSGQSGQSGRPGASDHPEHPEPMEATT
jgi:predicted RND superfamily exporter protein